MSEEKLCGPAGTLPLCARLQLTVQPERFDSAMIGCGLVVDRWPRYGRRVIDHGIIEQAAALLSATAPAGSTIILFGSHSRGEAGEESDLDFLVIEPEVVGRAREMVRLRDALDPLGIAADVVVASREDAEGWDACRAGCSSTP